MSNSQNTAVLLLHFLALLSQRLAAVSSNLHKRNEINPHSIASSRDFSRFIGEDIFSTPLDQTDFDAEIACETKEGVRFSFAIQLRYVNQTWTLEADISEIQQHGGTVRSSFPEISSPNLTEIVSAAEPACDWLVARATDFDFKTRPF